MNTYEITQLELCDELVTYQEIGDYESDEPDLEDIDLDFSDASDCTTVLD